MILYELVKERRKEEMANNSKRNAEGYLDPTAHEVMKNIDKEETRFNKLLHTIFYLCDLAGFEIGERIILVDKKTGRIWR